MSDYGWRGLDVDALAIVAIRNDAAYAANCLRNLIAEGLGVAVIDNDSTDDLREILARAEFRPHLVDYSRLPFAGSFELARILERRDEMAARVGPDWVVYVDVDEVLHSYREGERVADALAAADASGFNAINFDEFVFLPIEHDYVPDLLGWQPLLHYYFFEPRSLRLVRARRHDAAFPFAVHGIHALSDPRTRLFPESLVNRHYIFRSAVHAWAKYPERRFSPEALRRGRHINRHGYGPQAFTFPSTTGLKRLSRPDDRALDRSDPWRRHYWERSPRLQERAKGLARRAARSFR